jgi:hypothetical protein
MKEADKVYCDVSRVYIAPIAKSIAKSIIVKKHYTHSFSSCRYALGIYYKDYSEFQFGDSKLIGCLIYGFPVGRSASTSICDGLLKENALELTRLYIDDGYGSNIESYALGQSFKWLKENDKNIKLLLSYADAGQEHLGKIYQATNWIYQGTSAEIALMPNYGISLSNDPFDWIHSRTVSSLWGSHNVDHLKREIGKRGYLRFWRQMESPKHRYIQLLPQNKKEKRELMKSLKHEIRPYPKDASDFINVVEEHQTTYVATESENFW